MAKEEMYKDGVPLGGQQEGDTQPLLDASLLSEIFSDQSLENAPEQPVPLGLYARLADIPEERAQLAFIRPWAWQIGGALAASGLLVALMVTLIAKPNVTKPNAPSKEEIALQKAQQDLRIAFNYLGKANAQAERSVVGVIGDNLERASLLQVYQVVKPEQDKR